MSVGAWGYTKRQDDIRDLDAADAPVQRRSFGGYLTLEHELYAAAEGERSATAFLRVGASDGDTTPYASGWQAGVLVEHVFAARPDSKFSVGLNQGLLTRKFRETAFAEGAAAQAETQLEFTYADTIGGVTIQPDIQFIANPGGDRTRDTAVVGALRLSISL